MGVAGFQDLRLDFSANGFSGILEIFNVSQIEETIDFFVSLHPWDFSNFVEGWCYVVSIFRQIYRNSWNIELRTF